MGRKEVCISEVNFQGKGRSKTIHSDRQTVPTPAAWIKALSALTLPTGMPSQHCCL